MEFHVFSKTASKVCGDELTCRAVHRLVTLIPDGQKMKHQVKQANYQKVYTCIDTQRLII